MKKLVFVLLIAILGIATASAQQQRRSPEERLKMELDQMTEALSLDKAQVEKIKPILKESQDKQTEMMRKMREAGDQPDFQKMREEREKMVADVDKKIGAIISKEQVVKLQAFRKKQDEERRSRMNNR